MRNATGLRTIARPIATRWRCPPESALGLRCRYSVRPRDSAAFSTRTFASSLDTPAQVSGKAMFWATDMCGYRA